MINTNNDLLNVNFDEDLNSRRRKTLEAMITLIGKDGKDITVANITCWLSIRTSMIFSGFSIDFSYIVYQWFVPIIEDI